MLSAADEGAAAAERRAGARRAPTPRPRERRWQASGLVVALTPFKDAAVDDRRRAAADRAVHRDRGHLRQRRRPRAEFPRRRQAARRRAPGLEGAARARQPARPGRLRAGDRRRGARRGAGRPGDAGGAAGQPRRRRSRRTAPASTGAGARGRRADLRHRRAGAPRARRCSSPPMRARRVVGLPTRAVAAARPAARAPRCGWRRARPAPCCRRAKTRRWPPTPVRVAAGHAEHRGAGRDVRRRSRSRRR